MSKDNTDNKNNKKTKTTNKSNRNSSTTKKTTKKSETKNNTKTKATRKKENMEEKKEPKKVITNIEEDIDNELYFDEDLEDFYNDSEYEEEPIVVKEKTKKEEVKKEEKKNDSKKEETEREKIKRIEKIAKKNNKAKKKTTTTSDTLSKLGYFLDNNRNIILAFIVGVVATLIVAFILWPDRIATLKNGEQPIVKVAGKTYTADALYKQMKDHYSVSQLLDKIDNDILTKKYPETEEMKKEVKSTAENYINMYKQYYNYTQEQFLSANGFSSYDAYLDYLMLDNRRKKYENEYVEKNLSDSEIEKYYNENVYGSIKCEHVLVEVTTEDTSKSKSSKKLKDEDAKKLAQEIIDKINDGTSWKDIQKEYKDKVTYENLGYQAWDSDLESSFKDALKDMEDKSYSDKPVKTSYGYHVIYRDSQKKTPTLKKTKNKIIDKMVAEKIQEDTNMLYKALINLRKEKKIKFSDTDMKAKYDTYVKQYNK